MDFTLKYLGTVDEVIKDSKTIGEWISCCMRKHGPKGDGTMTHEQCVAAAHQKKDFVYDFMDINKISNFKDITHDFKVIGDFVVFHGSIARDGPYDYIKDGRVVTVYKDWDDLKELYPQYDYLPMKVSEEDGSHYADEFGFGFNFYPNEETHEIEADLVIVDESQFNEIIKDKDYHVSPGYHDDIRGSIQYILDVDHIALALGDEIARACTGTNEKGASCTTVKKVQNQKLKSEAMP